MTQVEVLVTWDRRLDKRVAESGGNKDTIVVERFDRAWPKQRRGSSAGTEM